MSNKLFFAILASILTILGCTAQEKANQRCNRKVADSSLAKALPKGICVPDNYTVEDLMTNVDFDRDGKNDVIIRCNQYPLKDGNIRIYGVFKRLGDTTFVMQSQLNNVIPPYLKNVYAAATGKDSLSAFLVSTYPYDVRVQFLEDTIKVSHSIPEFYGKTYEFVFEKNRKNWYLKRTKYWIGGMDERDIEQMGLSPKLSHWNTIEVKVPRPISIDEFNLVESRRSAENEEREYLTSAFNLFEWSAQRKKR